MRQIKSAIEIDRCQNRKLNCSWILETTSSYSQNTELEIYFLANKFLSNELYIHRAYYPENYILSLLQ